jgi:hypothetical protein
MMQGYPIIWENRIGQNSAGLIFHHDYMYIMFYEKIMEPVKFLLSRTTDLPGGITGIFYLESIRLGRQRIISKI